MNRKTTFLLVLIIYINSYAQNFTSVWDTSNIEAGSSANNQITIPTNPAYTYNYIVDWGDGQTDANVTGDITHTYTTEGEYTINISGSFPSIYFNQSGDKLKIIEILSWGNIQWQTMENAFDGCENLNFDAIDAPDLSQVTTLKNMFRNCTRFNGIVNNWNVSTITDISGMFDGAQTFNRPLANWNVSNVTDMSLTFSRTRFNEPLDGWNVARVTNMSGMFFRAFVFNQNINSWNVGNVTDMSQMFSEAFRYNQPVNNWNVARVTNMASMFDRAREFNQPLNNWNVSNVTNMTEMFSGFLDMIFNQPLDNWEVSNVTSMAGMFTNCVAFNQDISSWNVTSVTDMSNMFEGAITFNQPIGSWNVGNVTNMQEMFKEDSSFRPMIFNQPIGSWDVGNVTNMQEMFKNCTVFNQPIGGWNVGKVTSMLEMFYNASAFNQPLNNWVTTDLAEMEGMFALATVFNQPVSNWDVSKVDDMTNLFYRANAFDQSLENWNITNVENMTQMLSATNLSKDNYDNTLISWASQTVKDNVTLDVVGLNYCEGREERQELINDHNWRITGDAVDCDFVLCTEIISPQNGDNNVPANSDIRWNPAPNATGYIVTIIRRDDMGNILQIVKDNEDVGNVVGVTFTNEFFPGDNVFVTVTPYNTSGQATGCEEIQFKTVPSWVNSPDAFKITIDTRNLDVQSTSANQIILETTRNLTYNYSVDWGDNQYDNGVTSEITHTYLNPGIYTIAIIGDYPSHVYNSTRRDNKKLISVDQWGTQVWQTMRNAFWFCENMEYNATDVPNLSSVTDMARMFRRCELFDGDINNWDVSNVTNMENVFYDCEIFNQPLDNWNVGNVTDMKNMFFNAKAFNQPLNSWNVSNVTDMLRMFRGAEAFNQPLDSWNTEKVTNMQDMFYDCIVFNQPLDTWNVSNVESMESMFSGAIAFNSALNNWTMGKVTNMQRMFFNALAFNQPLDNWNVSTVTEMQNMFNRAIAFNQPINVWDVSNVTSMSSMFDAATTFNQPLDQWNVSSVTFMSRMFARASNFNQNINDWEVTNVRSMDSMFESAIIFNQPLDQWDVNSVVAMNSMFKDATVFNQPIGNWNVSAVANMSSMFEEAVGFNQPLNNWDVSSVTLMESMFKEATIFNQPINNWEVASVTNMSSMFEKAIAFNQPLNNWNTSEVLTMNDMFNEAILFNQNIDNWNVSFVTTMESMFRKAEAYDQSMNSWNVASVISMANMFNGALVFNSTINDWNVRNVENMTSMFANTTSFNQSLNSWRVSNVNNMRNMFNNAQVFNQPLDNWDLGSVNMERMFSSASAFNQNLANWNVSLVTNMNSMLDLSGLNRENYDNTLIAWSQQNLTPGITLGARDVPYCDALEERQSIIGNYSWRIEEDVLDCPIPECTRIITELQGATNVPVNTNLTWDAAQFARGYRVIVTVGGTEIVNQEVTDTFYDFPTDFSGGETVMVTITPFNDEGDATGPCTEDSFTIATTPAAVPNCTTLTMPANGTTNVSVDTNLSWIPIINANGYTIIIGTSAGASDVLNEDVGNITTYNPTTDLPEDTELFVSIIPYNEEGDATGCTEERFTTQIIPKPPICTNLTSPLNGATNVAIDTNISWNAVADATGYLVTIGSVSGAIDIANSVDVNNVTTYNIPTELRNDRTYYVTIIPYNAIGDATGCIEESFSTGSATPTIPSCTTLSSPLNGATNVATNLSSISWNPIGNANGYLVTVTGTTNNNVTDADITSGTTYMFANTFNASENVNVSITPYNAAGNATGCTSESFTIEAPTLVIPNCTTLSSPLNGATNVATNLSSISWNPIGNADGYLVTVTGTTNNNVTDADITSGTTYTFANTFNASENVNVSITPYNAAGNATGCTSESFTIEAPTLVIPNCTTLSSPLNGATNVATNLSSISWNPVGNADGYLVTVTGTTNNNVTDADITSGTTYTFANTFNASENVNVSITPYNAAGNATGCTLESFTIEAPTLVIPNCTTLSSPLNGATNVATNLSSISWNPVGNADGYLVTVTGTTNNNVTDADITSGTTYTFANTFNASENVNVSITPYNAAGNATGCTSESFTIEAPTLVIPNCTTLSSPLNGATNVATNLSSISWNPIGNADGYLVTITGTTNNNVTDADVTSGTTYTFANTFNANENVSVTITPYNAAGSATGCTSESFTIENQIEIVDDNTKYGFSPDGDGINEFWRIDGIENYPENIVSIYNRWGDKVFEISGYNNTSRVFRGDANRLTNLGGRELPEGTYFFNINVSGNTSLKKLKGFLVLKR